MRVAIPIAPRPTWASRDRRDAILQAEYLGEVRLGAVGVVRAVGEVKQGAFRF